LVYFQRVTDPVKALRVVIADDHHFFREGLRGTLQDAGMEIVGEASNGAEALALARKLQPDVLVLDLNMPRTSGLVALQGLVQSDPGIQTVVLTVSTEDLDVLDALAAGACGYLLKDTRADRLAEGIRQAAEGHMVLSREVAQALTARVRAEAEANGARPAATGEPAVDEASALTPRETEVLRLLAGGADNATIGRELSISPHTVKQYVANIFEKLGVGSRVQAAVYAIRAGLL
jgi:DNA-binding NarL/FixJ family response regulator